MSEFADTVLTLAKEGDFDTIKAAIAEHEAEHLQELRAYEVTVANRDARIAQLEAQHAAVQQGVQPESIGKTCMDGGTCHHDCKERCFRRECCAPLTVALNAGLTIEQWRYPVTHPTQQGLDAQELLAALGDLSFACFGGIGTVAPDRATYNRTFAVLEKCRAAQAKQAD